VTKNLISDTKRINWSKRIEGESDHYAAAYYNLYNPNDFIDNIAVGGER